MTIAMNRRLTLALAATIFAAAPAGALTYSVRQIDFPGASSTYAYGVNDAGDIVGDIGAHGFVYTGGSFTQIDVSLPGATGTTAYGINNDGAIVGIFAANHQTHGFLDVNGNFSQIDVPGATATYAYGINDGGEIVGRFRDSTGTHGFLDVGGNFTQIDVPGQGDTEAYGINDSGAIVGSSFLSGYHGFVDIGGSFTQLDFPATPTAYSTVAYGINDTGEIVGFTSAAPAYNGFLYDGHTFTTTDFTYGYPRDINDSGQIVGWLGTGHGFLATPYTPPVPEPSSFALLGAGLLGLSATYRLGRMGKADRGHSHAGT